MPLITLATNQEIKDKPSLCLDLSKSAAQLLNKPESYVMALVEDNQALSFAGNHEPAAYLQLKSLDLPEDQTAGYSEKISAMITEHTGIPANRIYIEFSSPARHLWGWNSGTFG